MQSPVTENKTAAQRAADEAAEIAQLRAKIGAALAHVKATVGAGDPAYGVLADALAEGTLAGLRYAWQRYAGAGR